MREKVYKSEKDVKAEIKRIFDRHGWFWWMPPANGFGKIGISDFNAVRRGPLFMAVEAKFGKNKPTIQQKAFLQSVLECSGFGFVVDETTISVFELFMQLFDEAASKVMMGAREKGDIRAVGPEIGAQMLNCISILTAPLVDK